MSTDVMATPEAILLAAVLFARLYPYTATLIFFHMKHFMQSK